MLVEIGAEALGQWQRTNQEPKNLRASWMRLRANEPGQGSDCLARMDLNVKLIEVCLKQISYDPAMLD